jgi:hypothetical protein
MNELVTEAEVGWRAPNELPPEGTPVLLDLDDGLFDGSYHDGNWWLGNGPVSPPSGWLPLV